MIESVYTLPDISFVAGDSQTIRLSFFTPQPSAQPFNVNGCTIDFSIINYSNKNGIPVLSKTGVPIIDAASAHSVALVDLTALDTLTLYGKYIYQVSVIDPDGVTDIPNQGIIYITKNINQDFIRHNAP